MTAAGVALLAVGATGPHRLIQLEGILVVVGVILMVAALLGW